MLPRRGKGRKQRPCIEEILILLFNHRGKWITLLKQTNLTPCLIRVQLEVRVLPKAPALLAQCFLTCQVRCWPQARTHQPQIHWSWMCPLHYVASTGLGGGGVWVQRGDLTPPTTADSSLLTVDLPHHPCPELSETKNW